MPLDVPVLSVGAPRRWLLVTGMPRSGTTFAGRVLSAPLAVDYIHEPFNPDCGIVGVDQLLVHTRLGAANEPEVRRAVDDLMHYRARLRTGHFARDSAVKGAVKRGPSAHEGRSTTGWPGPTRSTRSPW